MADCMAFPCVITNDLLYARQTHSVLRGEVVRADTIVPAFASRYNSMGLGTFRLQVSCDLFASRRPENTGALIGVEHPV